MQYSVQVFTKRFGSWYDTLRAAGLDLSHKPTVIERALYNILEELEVEWQKEVTISGFRADTVLLVHDVVIEVDGDYWHGHPDELPYDDRQKKGIKRDARKNRVLKENGYLVIRFWGSSVRNAQEQIKQTIQEIVQREKLPEHGKHVFGPEPFADTEPLEH